MKDKILESKFINIQNKKMHYKIQVDKEGTHKPFCIFIHGASKTTQHTDFWVPLLPIITKHCQPIFLDGYGHGLSVKPQPDEKENYYDILLQIYQGFIEAIIESEHIENFVLIGRSLGGYAVHNLAQKFEQKLLAIGLIAPGGASLIPETLKNWNKKISVLWDTEDPVVSFETYSYIESTVKQCKLFCIGDNTVTKNARIVTRNNAKKPSHVPELDYPDIFEEFLCSLVE